MSSYTQLVSPDLSVEGQIAYCLQYAARVFHCTTGMYSAWDAWMSTRHPHTDALPTDVAVPAWFDYTTDGYRYGHVVVSVPGQGFYSSPYNKQTGHNVLGSISEIERLYGVKYVGWSEDILERTVIKQGEDDMPNDGDITNALRLAHNDSNYQPTQDELDRYKRPDWGWKKLFYDVQDAVQKQLDANEAQKKLNQIKEIIG